ncbi:hypothetical protein PMI38_04730, partial [Pseudomonas sp. GM84]
MGVCQQLVGQLFRPYRRQAGSHRCT